VEIHRTFGNHGKLPVKIPDEFREESVSFLHGVNALQPQFFDESILEGLVDLFNSPFGLGAVGEYELDAKLIHRSPELCFSVAVFYSCGKSFGRVHPEDSMAIKVERERFPVRFQIRSGCAKVGIGRFTYGKRKMQEFTGSIVNVNEERAGGGPIFKPMVRRSVHLDEFTLRAPPVPKLVDDGCRLAGRLPESDSNHGTSQGFPGIRKLMVTDQLLMNKRNTEICIPLFDDDNGSVQHRRICFVVTGYSPELVDKGIYPLPAIYFEKPPYLSNRHAHDGRCLFLFHGFSFQLIQNADTIYLFDTHMYILHVALHS